MFLGWRLSSQNYTWKINTQWSFLRKSLALPPSSAPLKWICWRSEELNRSNAKYYASRMQSGRSQNVLKCRGTSSEAIFFIALLTPWNATWYFSSLHAFRARSQHNFSKNFGYPLLLKQSICAPEAFVCLRKINLWAMKWSLSHN